MFNHNRKLLQLKFAIHLSNRSYFFKLQVILNTGAMCFGHTLKLTVNLLKVLLLSGVEKLHKLMPEIISIAERTDIAPHVKDGYIMMFIYMPSVFTNEFTRYIGQIINPILKALADENEYVRETALKAGQRIVNLYADSAILLLLPELERGLFDDNWRIRYRFNLKDNCFSL